MSEVRFYHLTRITLERALPTMLERTLQRGLRAVVRGAVPDRLAFLDAHVWTYGDGSFLPHGSAAEGNGARQPVWLTEGNDMPNGAKALFLIDGADATVEELADMDVAAILFDGHDPAAVDAAREHWRAVTGAGLAAVYWAKGDDGRWEKRHEAKPEST